MITDRDIAIVQFTATHYTVTATQVRHNCIGDKKDPDGRITRRRLQALVQGKLLNRTRCEVVNPLHGFTASVYFPSRMGLEILSVRTGDDRWLSLPVQTPAWQNLRHWTMLTDVRLAFQQAVAAQTRVQMPHFFNEFDVVNPTAETPAERFRLYTLCSTTPRRVVCCPDAALVLQAAISNSVVKRALYLELEAGGNPPSKAAAEKTPGYHALAEQKLHRKHFPDAMDTFGVLCLAPDGPWRDALRRAFRSKIGVNLWKFAALTDVKADTSLLFAPIFYPAEGEPVALVKGGGA